MQRKKANSHYQMVFSVVDGKAGWPYVTTAGSGSGFIAITDWIVEGEQVITGGHSSLAHDAPVAVVGE